MRKVVNVGDVKVRLVVNKEYKIMDSYRGELDVVSRLVGNSKRCCIVDGVNGDGCDEFILWEGIDEIVKKGVEGGLWKINRNKLEVVDSECWNKFFDVVVY